MKRFLLALGLVVGLSLVTAASASAADHYHGYQGGHQRGYPGQYQGYPRNNAYYHNGHVHHNGHIHPAAPIYRPPVYCPPTYYPQQQVYRSYYPSQNYISVQGPRFRLRLGF